MKNFFRNLMSFVAAMFAVYSVVVTVAFTFYLVVLVITGG
jgi:hypothetical protein